MLDSYTRKDRSARLYCLFFTLHAGLYLRRISLQCVNHPGSLNARKINRLKLQAHRPCSTTVGWLQAKKPLKAL